MTQHSDPLAPVRDQLARGAFDAAEASCRAALAARPDDARALGLLAHVLHRAGRIDEALANAERSLALQPRFAPALMEKAAAAKALARWHEARTAIEALLELSPRKAVLHYDLGTTLAKLGEMEAARAAMERALALDRRFAEADFALGMLDLAAGRHAAALQRFTRCTDQRAGWAEAWTRRAECLLAVDRPEEAILSAQEALRAKPDSADVLRVYARALYAAKHDYAEWIWAKRRICEVEPRVRNKVDLALALWQGMFYREAAAELDAAVAREPEFWAARWGRFQHPLELFPQSDDAARSYLERWREGLADMERRVAAEPTRVDDMRDCILLCTNFYLHYLGLPFVEEQRRYGLLLNRMMLAATPDVPSPKAIAPPAARRRIGFVSAYLNNHTVMKLFGNIIAGLDRDAFELTAFMLDEKAADARTEMLREGVDHLVLGPPDVPTWIGRLRAAELDVLVFPDIGMHPITHALAALRFAPVQCVMWGHPVTTGLETIDYFLSSELMEPPDAEAHYNEQLVRLPNLGTVFVPPEAVPEVPPSFVRRDDPAAVEIFFAQSVYKITPQHDDVFARIAAQVPGARFHLVPHPQPHVRHELFERMRPVFARHGLAIEEHVVLHPSLRLPQFLGLAQACDFNLDSIGWSGGNTTLEILSLDVPTITLPGALLRARHTYAILKRLDLDELIASDVDDYVRLAAELARDRPRRKRLRALIAERKHLLYHDRSVIEALNRFFATVMPPS